MLSTYNDGLGEVPRPIPIIIGAETRDVPKHDWWITMKVIEHGFPDEATRYMIRGTELLGEAPALTAVMDRMIHNLLLAVGRRHGIWVCTLTIADFRYGSGMNAEESYRDHLVADGVYRLARAASTYSPLVMYDPNRMTASLYDEGPSFKDILRENLREADLIGLGEEYRRGDRGT